MQAAVLLGIVLAAPVLDPAQQSRLRKLENALLAPCCYQEVVATHSSEVAEQMREELAAMVAEGRSDREILDHYRQRYGPRVLAEPIGAQWWLMNLVPVAMLLAGGLVVVGLVRRWRRGTAPEPA